MEMGSFFVKHFPWIHFSMYLHVYMYSALYCMLSHMSIMRLLVLRYLYTCKCKDNANGKHTYMYVCTLYIFSGGFRRGDFV